MGLRSRTPLSTLALLCVGVVGVLATWFSATAVVPELLTLWQLTSAQAAWLTNGVQIGFVVGALAASVVNLPDLIRLPRLMAVSAVIAAMANAGLLVSPSAEVAVALRIITGVALAGVYPAALKLMATWFVKGRGLALGCLIGALTLGSSMPHLFRVLFDGVPWQSVVLASSATSLAAALLFVAFIQEGPHAFGRAVFNPRQCLQVFSSKPLLLANLGYFGHMWELYAMWAWLLAFATAAAEGLVGFPFDSPSLFCFVVVATGVVGCLLGGYLSDRIGRCYTTIGMMLVSGTCALLMGVFYDGPSWLLALIALLWGASVIGDSAQFSAAVTELADSAFVGTALALQLGLGFALTVLAIAGIPVFVEWLGGWQWAFLLLAPGPFLGALAMAYLRKLPEAKKLAGGLG